MRPPGPAPDRPPHDGQAARLLVLVITVASGLVLLPLIVALVSTLSFLDNSGEGGVRAAMVTGWLVAALLTALWNLFVGVQSVDAPTWRGVGLLYGPTTLVGLIALIFLALT